MRSVHRARSAALCGIVGCAIALGGGCKRPLTHVVVDLDTDIPMSALPELLVQCGYNWNGEEDLTSSGGCEATITRGPGGAVSARVCLPTSFGISIAPNRENQAFTLVISNATSRYRNILRVTPVPEEVRLLRVRVHSACLVESAHSDAHPCPISSNGRPNDRCTLSESCIAREQTCGNGGTCVTQNIGHGDLAVIPRTGPPDAALTPTVNGMCPLSDFGADSGVSSSDATTDTSDAPRVDAMSSDATGSEGS